MAALSNDFSWSVSRDQLFRTCPRAYYYNYYGSWGGWAADAPERTRRLYLLKNIKSLAMWGGSLVHEVVAEALNRYARTGHPITVGELQASARTRLRSGWVEAVNEQWRRRPKKTNLHELYYGNGKTLPRETTDALRDRVYGCLAAFVESPVLREILAVPFLQWKPVDTLDTFDLEGIKIWCAIDFAYTDSSGILRLLDWKTGGENRETITIQLGCYALFAMDSWYVPFEKIRCHGVFLRENARTSDYPITAELLVETKDHVLTSAARMREMLDDVEGNVGSEDRFPCRENESVCRRCNFREVCPAVGE